MTSTLTGRHRADRAFLKTVLDAATGWRTRRDHHISARVLSRMDDHMLTDIGVTRMTLAFGRSPDPEA
ncbi:MAG: DUF1127 domain-containing protein [Rhizobiaceae bacterium]